MGNLLMTDTLAATMFDSVLMVVIIDGDLGCVDGHRAQYLRPPAPPISSSTHFQPHLTRRRPLAATDASPIIPAWLERTLMPGLGTPASGLERGFKPFQAPSFCTSASEACQPGFWEGAPVATERVSRLTAASAVDTCVVARSEFLLPLGEDGIALHRRVLSALGSSAPT